MNIYDLRKGQSARISRFEVLDGQGAVAEAHKRLIELGFAEGVVITLKWRDPLPGGPIVVEIRGWQVAIGRLEAESLSVCEATSAKGEVGQ